MQRFLKGKFQTKRQKIEEYKMKKTPGYVILEKEELDLLEKVRPQALAIYIHLRKRMNIKNGLFMSFPSQSKLAEEIGYSPESVESVRKYTEELRDAGLLKIEKSRDAKTRVWNSHKYYFVVLENTNGRATVPTAPTGQEAASTSANLLGYTSGNRHNYKEVNKEETRTSDFASTANAEASSSFSKEESTSSIYKLASDSGTNVPSSSEQANNQQKVVSSDAQMVTSSDTTNRTRKKSPPKAVNPPAYQSLEPIIRQIDEEIKSLKREKSNIPSSDGLK